MSGTREMTLKEWVERLPEFHYAHKEYKRLVAAVEAAPQPQASAEDVALVAGAVIAHAARYPGSKVEEALERVFASLGVGK